MRQRTTAPARWLPHRVASEAQHDVLAVDLDLDRLGDVRPGYALARGGRALELVDELAARLDQRVVGPNAGATGVEVRLSGLDIELPPVPRAHQVRPVEVELELA